jgi:riboflavin synthase
MFTGIIETMGRVEELVQQGSNVNLKISSPITNELKIDQSVAHNGICLTVTSIDSDSYWVTAVDETLKKTNLGDLAVGRYINLERCMQMNGRLDGHMVQGHVDQTGICTSVKEQDGSWLYDFEYDPSTRNATVEKGSICINGVSLTVFDSKPGSFRVTIIPYTYEHTTFKTLKAGQRVNLEFDIIGKYILTFLKNNNYFANQDPSSSL